jgi:ribosomal protein S27E
MAPTGAKSRIAGIYKPNCGHEQCVFGKGSIFPSCPTCQMAVMWTLVRPTK